jgi:hypothetical protein
MGTCTAISRPVGRADLPQGVEERSERAIRGKLMYRDNQGALSVRYPS